MSAIGTLGQYWTDFSRTIGWLMNGDHALLFAIGTVWTVGGAVNWSLRKALTDDRSDALNARSCANQSRWAAHWQQTVRYSFDRLGDWFGRPLGFKAYDRSLIIVVGYALFGPLLALSIEHVAAVSQEWVAAKEAAILAAIAFFFGAAAVGGVSMWVVSHGPFPILERIFLEPDVSSKVKSGLRVLIKCVGVIIGAALVAFVAGGAVGAGVKSGTASAFIGSATFVAITAIALAGALAAGVRGIAAVASIAIIVGVCSANNTDDGGILEFVSSALRTGIVGGAVVAGIMGAAGIKVAAVLAAATIVANIATISFMAGFGGMLTVGTYAPIFAVVALIPTTAILTATMGATVLVLMSAVLGLNAFFDWVSWWVGRTLAHPSFPNADISKPGLWPIARQLLIALAAATASSVILSGALAFSLGLAVRFGLNLDWELHLENAYRDPLGSGIGLTMMLASPWLPVAFLLTTGLFSLIFPILWSLVAMTGAKSEVPRTIECDPSRPRESGLTWIIPVNVLLSTSVAILSLVLLSVAICTVFPNILPWLVHAACDIGNWAEGNISCVLQTSA